MTKTFLVLVFCILAIDNGVSAYGIEIGTSGAEIEINMVNSRVPMPPPHGWIVIMERFDGSLDFERTWTEYKNGFGELGLQNEFWLGNEVIHQMTNGASFTLRVEVHTNGAWFYADYATFSLDSEDNKYAIHVSGFSGNAGDALSNTAVETKWNHNGMGFSTSDADNDQYSQGSCSSVYKGGWWFNDCHYSCLTCVYGGDSFVWESLRHLPTKGVLEGARMRIKPN